ncbi:hypothetical protein ACI2L1_28230 [Streptomyces sp. NPDC019531]|uniref:hypothetical protein n=1 Tax=Streptomyces sp. NPDC019531 TaxID=3365062 RepID=UPI00384BBC1D
MADGGQQGGPQLVDLGQFPRAGGLGGQALGLQRAGGRGGQQGEEALVGGEDLPAVGHQPQVLAC